MLHPIKASARHGSHIHRASDTKVTTPLAEKKSAPIGETRTGVYGANMRALSNGHHSAAPNPPLVSVSSRPWLAIANVRNRNAPILRASFHSAQRMAAQIAAKAIAWVAPLWPQVSAYSIPSLNPITSASGSIANAAPVIANLGEIRPRPAAAAIASGTMAWVMIVGIIR